MERRLLPACGGEPGREGDRAGGGLAERRGGDEALAAQIVGEGMLGIDPRGTRLSSSPRCVSIR